MKPQNIVFVPGFQDFPNGAIGGVISQIAEEQGYHFYGLKLPGHQGDSTPFSMTQTRQRVENILFQIPGDITVITHSLSALSVIDAIENLAQRVNQLILINPALNPLLAVRNMYHDIRSRGGEKPFEKPLLKSILTEYKNPFRILLNGKVNGDPEEFITDIKGYLSLENEVHLTEDDFKAQHRIDIVRDISHSVDTHIIYNPGDTITETVYNEFSETIQSHKIDENHGNNHIPSKEILRKSLEEIFKKNS